MAGDWVKMRSRLADDPLVIAMAEFLLAQDDFRAWAGMEKGERYVTSQVRYGVTLLNVTVCVTVAGLLAVWGVARERGDRENDDLTLAHCTESTLETIAKVPKMGDAMAHVGWFKTSPTGTGIFPNYFKEHVPPEDRQRAQGAARQAAYRVRHANVTSNARSNVTRDVTRNVTVTHREEKRRVKKEHKARTSRAPLSFEPPPWIKHEAWAGFVAMRVEEKQPLTDSRAKRIVTKLDAMRAEGHDPNVILATSTANGWRGVYAPTGRHPRQFNFGEPETLDDMLAGAT